MLVIPSIDVLGGRTVRLYQGDYSKVTTYDGDPVEVARGFVTEGAHRIHVVDLDGARAQGDNFGAIEGIITAAGVEVQVGGGVRSPEAVERLLSAGAAYVVVGTVAAERPGDVGAWALRWPGRVYIGLDARDGSVATHGWEKHAGWTVDAMIQQYRDVPVAGFIYTEISRDGALLGAATETLAELVDKSPHPVILSGGVTTLDDLVAARAAGAAGAIIGRAIHEGRITVADAIQVGEA
ncbi:MAG: phosphoribosylformimino-5-aminoimidazole carboxamide ribotide isomerase [Chloroflexota bacterium]|nr:phosphoribosylformimino-5-aminoimidazole carboxamide ribotide isomerase [Chloroflexota bacterium]